MFSVRTNETPPKWLGLAGKLGHPGLKAPYEVDGCKIVGPTIVRASRGMTVKQNTYSFNVKCGREEKIWKSQKVATALGLIGATDVPGSRYRCSGPPPPDKAH